MQFGTEFFWYQSSSTGFWCRVSGRPTYVMGISGQQEWSRTAVMVLHFKSADEPRHGQQIVQLPLDSELLDTEVDKT